MRGAPQVGFSRHILRIRSRTSREMTGRPGWPRRTFQVQKRRKPARCQATTVSGLTMASAERQSRQRRERQIHKRRSPEVNFRRFAADLCSTPIWWRRARFSSATAARERRIEGKIARSVVRKTRISENYEARISHICSDISRFSGATDLRNGLTNMQRLFLFGKLSGLNDKNAALAAGYALSVAENTKQRIWKPQVMAEYNRIKSTVTPFTRRSPRQQLHVDR